MQKTPLGLLVALLIGWVALPVCAEHAAPRAERPNIILMMADDLGWGDVGYQGNELIRTPNLDRMAATGLRFNRFYAAAPVCSPTRGSCLTGRHPFRYGIFHANVGHLPAEELTLVELLRALGYRTGHFGKWHLGTLTTDLRDSNRGGPANKAHFCPPQWHGFDENFSTEAKVPTWDPMLKPAGKQAAGSWWDPIQDPAQAAPYNTHYWSAGQPVMENLRGDDSRVIMDRVIPFIRRSVEQDRPFIAVVWFHAPHLPVVAGPQYTQLYSERPKYTQHYYGCITAMDEQIGRLQRALDELGVAGNTMLWFCSDNGPEGQAGKAPGSAGPLRGRKRDLFEGGVRVPGLLVWPDRVPRPRTTDVPACTSDYLPTIVDALGIEMPDQRPIDGLSLLPLLDGTMTERPTPIGFQSGRQAALVDNRYKLLAVEVASRHGGAGNDAPELGTGGRPANPPQYLLFDLLADPGEQHDLAAEHPAIVRQMAEALDRFRASCRASLTGKDYPQR